MFTRRSVLGTGAATSIDLLAAKQAASEERTYRILSIDGGGIRGVAAAQMLVKLNDYLSKNKLPGIAQSFDLFAGTSTGSLIAAGLAVGGAYSNPKKIADIYLARGGEIFSHNHLDNIAKRLTHNPFAFTVPMYPSEGKTKIIRDVFGPKKLSELNKDFVVPFYNIGSDKPQAASAGAVIVSGGPNLMTKSDSSSDMLIADVVDASTSAPVYFNPVPVQDGKYLGVDGGVYANNPILLALSRIENFRSSNIFVLSIGCGSSTPKYPHYDYWSVAEWARPPVPLLEVMMHAQSSAADQVAEGLLGSQRYIRWQFDLPAAMSPMDNASDANMRNLVQLADRYMELPEREKELSIIRAAIT